LVGGKAPLGKKLLGLQVVTPEGEGLGFFRSLLRAIGYFPSGIFLELGFLWAFTNPLRRGWHDLIAGSVVVESGERPGWVRGLSSVLSVALFAVLLVSSAQTFLSGLGASAGTRAEVAAKARSGLDYVSELEEAHKAQTGRYTQDVRALAALAGGPHVFRDRLMESFRPQGFGLQTDKNGQTYLIVATALDGQEIQREGPNKTTK
jgi:hypothetical protein